MILFFSISSRLVRTYNSILSYNRWSHPLHFFQYNNGERIQVCKGGGGVSIHLSEVCLVCKYNDIIRRKECKLLYCYSNDVVKIELPSDQHVEHFLSFFLVRKKGYQWQLFRNLLSFSVCNCTFFLRRFFYGNLHKKLIKLKNFANNYFRYFVGKFIHDIG